MPLLLLGFLFVVGLIIYILFSKTDIDVDDDFEGMWEDEPSPFDEEENVIFLPSDIESVKEMYKKKK